jgi:hypothetical protein
LLFLKSSFKTFQWANDVSASIPGIWAALDPPCSVLYAALANLGRSAFKRLEGLGESPHNSCWWIMVNHGESMNFMSRFIHLVWSWSCWWIMVDVSQCW